MNLISFLTSPAADALGWTLLHAVWQGFVIALPTAVTLHLLRNRSSALRYRLGILALAVQLITSVVTFSWYYEPTVATTNQPVTQQINTLWQSEVLTLSWHQQVQQFLAIHLSQFVLVYLIGIVLFGLRLAGGWLYLQRLSRVATPPANATWNSLVGRLRATMRIRSVVQVRESARIAVPIVVGVLKPVLLIPIGLATNLSMQEVEVVLAHELAHVKRQDYGTNVIQSLIEVLYFFHPALWWLSARVREERELCCDDLAVQACGGDGRRLAQALARIEELRLTQTTPTPALAMAFATKRLQLLHRVRRMLGVPTRPVVSTRSLAGLTLVTILLVSVSVYAVQQDEVIAMVRYEIGAGTSFGVTGQNQLQYVDWKGKRLTSVDIQRLQRTLAYLINGKRTLSEVSEADREILTMIIDARSISIAEKRKALWISMDSLARALNINFSDMPSRQSKLQVDSTPVTEKRLVKTIDSLRVNVDTNQNYPQNVNIDVQTTVTGLNQLDNQDTTRLQEHQKELSALTEQMSAIMRQQQPVVDRLTKEMAQLTLMHSQSQKQIAPIIQQLSKLARQQGTLAKKLFPLQLELNKLENRQGAKKNTLLRQKQQRTEQLEAQMDQLGKQMETLSSRMEPLSTKLEPYNDRMSVIGDSISKLYEPTYALSERIGKLSEQIAADAYRQAESALRQAEDAFRGMEINGGAINRPARAPRAPRPPKLPIVPKPARPAVAPRPAHQVVPAVQAPATPPIPKAPKE